jgi:prephenate dehydrogenase
MTTAGPGHITVIGCTATGIALAHALTAAGLPVALDDPDPAALEKALAAGAGEPLTDRLPPARTVVVATAPHHTVDTLTEAQARGLGHHYTDLTGTLPAIRAEAELRGCDLGGYLPGHLIGRGPLTGRTWVLCPYPATGPDTLDAVTALVTATGAAPRLLAPAPPALI